MPASPGNTTIAALKLEERLMATDARPFISPEDYLKLERQAPTKSEYWNGHMYAMAGTSRKHAAIASNLNFVLRRNLGAKACRVYGSDLRLHIPATGLYTYRDITVTCGDEKFLDNEFDTLLNPVLIIEVSSPSTVDYDRGRKFESYRSIPSLKEYLTIAQDKVLIEQRAREEGERWLFQDYRDANGTLPLISLSPLALSIADIYEGVNE